MKKITGVWLLAVLVLLAGLSWAGQSHHEDATSAPAILMALDPSLVTLLDDEATAAVRGQAAYVLVKVIGLNTLDYGNVQWTWNPLGYRYGNYGGYNWSGGPVVDGMDACFQVHDAVYDATTDPTKRFEADQGLLQALGSLPNTVDDFWGPVYVSPAPGQPDIKVYGLSLVGGKVFRGWKNMDYSEYSRREAMWGVYFMILGKSILRIN